MKVESPYLTVEEARDYCRCKTTRAFYARRYRLKIKAHRFGGTLMFKQCDLDAAFEQERPARGQLRKVVG